MEQTEQEAAKVHGGEGNLDDMSFQKRWELVGSPHQQPEAPPRSLSYVSMHSSQRLTNLASELLQSPKGSVPFPASVKRIEPGSALRLLDPQAQQTLAAAADGLPAKKDPLAYVTKGLQALHGSTGPDALVRQRRRARHGDMPSREAKPLSRSTPALLLDCGGSGGVASSHGEGLGQGAEEPRPSTPGADAAAAPQRRRRGKGAGKSWAMREFREWSSNKFGGVEEAIAAIDLFGGGARAESGQFATALADLGYPMGKMGGKNLFKVIDSDEDGFISHSDIVQAASKMSVTRFVNKFASLQAEVERRLAAQDMDTIEAHVIATAAGLGASGATSAAQLHKQRDRILDDISSKEPLLGEFLKYLYSCYRTLKAAFRQMDVNQNQSLSRSEFNESVRTMRSKEGLHFIDAHLDRLYDCLCSENGGGALPTGGLQKATESSDPLIRCFGRFLAESLLENRAPPGEPVQLRTFEETFGRGYVSRIAFRAAVEELRYVEWLLNELFVRLDADGSGNITVNELTCFLEAEPPRPRPSSFAQLAPLGSDKRKEQILMGACMSAESPKLAQCGVRKARVETPQPSICRTNWKTEEFGHALRYQRPTDTIDTIREALGKRRSGRSRSYSDLEVTGQHSIKRSPDPVPDLCPPHSCALERFDLGMPRTRLTSGC